MLARTADNLFWLARQMERADFTARMIEATLRLNTLAPIVLTKYVVRGMILLSAVTIDQLKNRNSGN